MAPSKRPNELGVALAASAAKRPRAEGALVVNQGGQSGAQLVELKPPPRTSGLKAPTMKLTGHEAAVHSVKFSPGNGHMIASASSDKNIFLWRTYGDCENYAVLSGHRSAVMEVHWSADALQVFSASADKTLGVWDAESGRRLKKLTGHDGFVNGCCPTHASPHLLASASDDGTVKLWDTRGKTCTLTMPHSFQVTAVCFSADDNSVYSGSLDEIVRSWDIRKAESDPLLELSGHTGTITSLATSPDGSFLLSNAMDSTVRRWDVRPFAPGGDAGRCTAVFKGARQNFEQRLLRCSWSADGEKVAAGSADGTACIWDASSAAMLYKLPGHTGTVNEVVFHPMEPVVASCSSDGTILVGEIA